MTREEKVALCLKNENYLISVAIEQGMGELLLYIQLEHRDSSDVWESNLTQTSKYEDCCMTNVIDLLDIMLPAHDARNEHC